MARQTGWGYTRLLGELRKLGIRKVSRSTIKNILQAHDIQPSPSRGSTTWAEFLKRHTDTLWACDFFTQSVWTPWGFRRLHVLAFIHTSTRRVHIAGITAKPNRKWMAKCAKELVAFFHQQPTLPTMVLRDRDPRFTREFEAVLAQGGVHMQKLTPASPNLNAFIERWIQSIKQECLDHFIVFGQRHLHYLINEYVRYYHLHRPHQGLGNVPLHGLKPTAIPASPDDVSRIVCRSHLAGLLKHYERRAA
ncbi:MAG: transposase [Phycisphaeraceae bacterium]|nr:transposase [Phycisphaeraceae bacterium]